MLSIFWAVGIALIVVGLVYLVLQMLNVGGKARQLILAGAVILAVVIVLGSLVTSGWGPPFAVR